MPFEHKIARYSILTLTVLLLPLMGPCICTHQADLHSNLDDVQPFISIEATKSRFPSDLFVVTELPKSGKNKVCDHYRSNKGNIRLADTYVYITNCLQINTKAGYEEGYVFFDRYNSAVGKISLSSEEEYNDWGITIEEYTQLRQKSKSTVGNEDKGIERIVHKKPCVAQHDYGADGNVDKEIVYNYDKNNKMVIEQEYNDALLIADVYKDCLTTSDRVDPRQEFDREKDGKLEWVQSYNCDDSGNLEAMEIDANGDGKVDRIYTIKYDKEGRIADIETDADANGATDYRVSYNYECWIQKEDRK